MSEQAPQTPLPIPDETSGLTQAQLTVVLDEIARLQTLYLDARSSTQSVFNFFLTLLTAVIGGVIFLIQNDQSLLLQMGLLLFSSLVGSVYMGALSGRYGQATRYARMLDMLRRELFQRTESSLPAVYAPLLTDVTAHHRIRRQSIHGSFLRARIRCSWR